MHSNHQTLSTALQNGLAIYYLLVCAMNLGFAAYFFYAKKNVLQAAVWAIVGGIFLLHAGAYFAHAGWAIPSFAQESVNYVMNPITYFVAACLGLFLAL